MLFTAKNKFSITSFFPSRTLLFVRINLSKFLFCKTSSSIDSTCKSDSGLRAFSTNYRPPRGSDKIRASSGPSILPRPEDVINNEPEVVFNFPFRFLRIISIICINFTWTFVVPVSGSCRQKNRLSHVQIHRLYRIHCQCQNMVDILRN